jgi:hypothetical protein
LSNTGYSDNRANSSDAFQIFISTASIYPPFSVLKTGAAISLFFNDLIPNQLIFSIFDLTIVQAPQKNDLNQTRIASCNKMTMDAFN